MPLNLFDTEIADLEATITYYQQRLKQARTTQIQANETFGKLEAVVSNVATHPHALEAVKQSVLSLFGITLPKDPDRATDSASFYEILERQELLDAVAQLALPLQQAIDFVYFQRFSVRQPAKALDCKVQQVKENLDRAIALLAEKLVDCPQLV